MESGTQKSGYGPEVSEIFRTGSNDPYPHADSGVVGFHSMYMGSWE